MTSSYRLQRFPKVVLVITVYSLQLQQTLMDTNPYLLGLTVFVSILHSVFEFLAFKNGETVF